MHNAAIFAPTACQNDELYDELYENKESALIITLRKAGCFV